MPITKHTKHQQHCSITITLPSLPLLLANPIQVFQTSSIPGSLFKVLKFPASTSTFNFQLSTKIEIIMHSKMLSASGLALTALFTIQFGTISLGHPLLEQRAAPIVMGVASTFGAIAATSLTSTGPTVITGNCGTCPGTSVTGFGPPGGGVCTGTIYKGTTPACNAEAACLTAYNDAVALVSTKTLAATDLGGLTLGPGVYDFPTLNAVLSTTLTLNGTSNPNGQFIFQIKTTFVTSAGTAKVVLIGGAQACNVYFLVGSSATIGAGSILQGNLLAYTSISVNSGASNKGTFCALNGGISLIDDALTAQPTCTT